MIKKIIFIAFLFLSFNSFGQDIDELRKKASTSSDNELVVFIKKAKDQGLSLMDAEKQLILIGGKAKEVKKLRDLWNKKLSKKSETDLVDSNNNESQFGETEDFVKDSLSQDCGNPGSASQIPPTPRAFRNNPLGSATSPRRQIE